MSNLALVVDGAIIKQRATDKDAFVIVDGERRSVSLGENPTKADRERCHLFAHVVLPRPRGDMVSRNPLMLIGGVPTYTWTASHFTDEEILARFTTRKQEVMSQLEQYQIRATNAGVEIPNGMRINTDPEAQNALTHAFVRAMRKPDKIFNWVDGGDFASYKLTAKQVQKLHDFQSDYVELCWDVYQPRMEAIRDSKDDAELDLAEVGIELGWPDDD